MSIENSFGKTIELFLVDGAPSGLKKATIKGWSGLIFVSGASAFGKLTAREEVDSPGIYVLYGRDHDTEESIRVYIGSAKSVAERIRKSAADKHAFWETAVAITTSSNELSKADADYLEARLIQLTDQAGRVCLDNKIKPDVDRCPLPESDRVSMEQFLANLRIILPVIGLDMLKPQPRAVSQTAQTVEERTTGDVQFEIRHKSGVKATAVEEDGEFIILEGSEALLDPGYVQTSYKRLKEKLLNDGVLERVDTGKLRFVKPRAFRSPSAAAAVVLDRNNNGRTEWKVVGSKQTYHDWQQEEAANPKF